MQIIAHRGASGYKPENTLSAFEHAIDMGADMIELDVHRLKTGELIVIHDQTVTRTTDGLGKVERYTLEQIRKLDAGEKEFVPLLSEVLDLVDKRVPVNIELKGRGTAKPLADLLSDCIETKGWTTGHFIVSSFNHTVIRQFMRLMPLIPVGALVDRRPFWLRPLCYSDDVDGINMNAERIRPIDVEIAHKSGKQVYAYTVNTREAAEMLRQINVDGIFTNYPDIEIGAKRQALSRLAT